MKFNIVTCFLAFVSIASISADPPAYTNLVQYNVEPLMTLSGLSGGATFSGMMGFIYSSIIKGVGLFEGAPYPYAYILLTSPLNLYNTAKYVSVISGFETAGYIDSTSNLASNNFRAFVFHGSQDPIPVTTEADARNFAAEVRHYGGSTFEKYDIPAGHCVPVDNSGYIGGGSGGLLNLTLCGVMGTSLAICNCQYEGVFQMFSFLYGSSYNTPSSSLATTTGALLLFNQTEFLPNQDAVAAGWNDFGYAYVPAYCQNLTNLCKLHMAFHGCGEDVFQMIAGQVPYMVNSMGYQQAADANNIILIFPIALIDPVAITIGCMDVVGTTSIGSLNYLTRNGTDPLGVKKIYDRIYAGL